MTTIAGAVVAPGKHVDAQFSLNNSIILQVTGSMLVKVRKKPNHLFWLGGSLSSSPAKQGFSGAPMTRVVRGRGRGSVSTRQPFLLSPRALKELV